MLLPPGWMEEVRGLGGPGLAGPEPSPFDFIGYRECAPVNGEVKLREVKPAIQQADASATPKRQLTWVDPVESIVHWLSGFGQERHNKEQAIGWAPQSKVGRLFPQPRYTYQVEQSCMTITHGDHED